MPLPGKKFAERRKANTATNRGGKIISVPLEAAFRLKPPKPGFIKADEDAGYFIDRRSGKDRRIGTGRRVESRTSPAGAERRLRKGERRASE